MKAPACARSWEVDPYREGRLGAKDARAFERHLRRCVECRRSTADQDRLRELGRAVPIEEPGELTLRRVRARVLRDAERGPSTRRRLPAYLAAAVVAMAVALSAVLFVRSPAHPALAPATSASTAETETATPSASPPAAPEEPFAGAVTASAGARWSQERAAAIERVALGSGSLRVHVRPQVAGERFLVTLPDGELEVRGTTFEVSVEQGATARVHVDEGVVELRLEGRPPVRLGPAEEWPRGTRAYPSASPSVSAAPAPTRVAAEAYGAAMELLRAGRSDEAASAFHAFAQADPRAPQAEDASFLEAVALARAGRSDAAALAAEHHLASFPESFHRREASVLIARAAAQRGDCARARAVLTPWAGDGGETDILGALRSCQGR